MAGEKKEHQIRYWSAGLNHLRYNTGSLWSSLGLGPVTVVNEGETSGRLFWDDTRTTSPQRPNWRRLLAEGNCATTDLVGSRRRLLEFSPGTYESRWKTNPGQTTEFSYVYTEQGNLFRHEAEASGSSSYEDADNQASMNWFMNARAAQQTLQAGVIAGELGQTIRGLFQTAKLLRRGIDAYLNEIRYFYHKYPGRRAWSPKHRRLYNRREVREYLCDTWLSAAFGIRPLIKDIDDTMRFLATDKSILSDDVEVIGTGETSSKHFKTMPNGSYWSYDLNVEDNWSVKYYGRVYRYIPGPFPSKTSLQLGLDTSSWLPTVWELIPYSFLVDYFSNIQEVITSHAFNMTTLKWCSRARRRAIVSRVVNVVPLPNGPGAGYAETKFISPGSCTWSVETVDRMSEGIPRFVNFEFEIPGVRSMKWINMAALLGKSKAMTPYVW